MTLRGALERGDSLDEVPDPTVVFAEFEEALVNGDCKQATSALINASQTLIDQPNGQEAGNVLLQSVLNRWIAARHRDQAASRILILWEATRRLSEGLEVTPEEFLNYASPGSTSIECELEQAQSFVDPEEVLREESVARAFRLLESIWSGEDIDWMDAEDQDAEADD